jgi:CRISPR-associated endonuclease/helicase Cas3
MNNTQKFYGHNKEGKPQSEWQPLEEHLKNVAEMARGFAEKFGAGDWGYLVGLWHDLRIYINEF